MEEKKEKLVVDQNKCIGCGFCAGNDPEHFNFSDEGFAVVVDETVTEETKEIAEGCPVGAISIETE